MNLSITLFGWVVYIGATFFGVFGASPDKPFIYIFSGFFILLGEMLVSSLIMRLVDRKGGIARMSQFVLCQPMQKEIQTHSTKSSSTNSDHTKTTKTHYTKSPPSSASPSHTETNSINMDSPTFTDSDKTLTNTGPTSPEVSENRSVQ